jgi:hypothetical protein
MRGIIVFLIIAAGSFGRAAQLGAPGDARSPQDVNDRFVREQMARIAGRESEPAAQVFRNVQWLKDVPARTFIEIMDGGYSRALGVTCTHCHVESDFASDDKRPKKAAREMQVLHRGINDQLRKLQHLDIPEDRRLISCSTCHRGAIDPRTIPAAPR